MRVPEPRASAVLELGEHSVRNFLAHRMTTYAELLAYRAIFGLFPFLLLGVALMAVLRFDAFFARLVEGAASAPPQRVPEPLQPLVEQGRGQAEPLRELLGQAREQAGAGLLSLGVVVSLWSVSAVTSTLTEALNAAYEVAETRPGRKRFVFSLLFGPFLALAVIVATALMLTGLQVVEGITRLAGLDEEFVALWSWLRVPVAFVVLVTALSVVYRLVPNTARPFRFVAPGAALAAVLWVSASVAFSFYLATFAGRGLTYGSLGTAVGLLFYLYLSACVVLFGAEVNAAIYDRAARRSAQKEEQDPDHQTDGTENKGG